MKNLTYDFGPSADKVPAVRKSIICHAFIVVMLLGNVLGALESACAADASAAQSADATSAEVYAGIQVLTLPRSGCSSTAARYIRLKSPASEQKLSSVASGSLVADMVRATGK